MRTIQLAMLLALTACTSNGGDDAETSGEVAEATQASSAPAATEQTPDSDLAMDGPTRSDEKTTIEGGNSRPIRTSEQDK